MTYGHFYAVMYDTHRKIGAVLKTFQDHDTALAYYLGYCDGCPYAVENMNIIYSETLPCKGDDFDIYERC